MTSREPQAWFAKPWPLSRSFFCLSFLTVLLAGNPIEFQERRWVDQCLRWRLAAGLAQPVDDRIVHVDITEQDLAALPNLEAEYFAAGRLITEARDLGARLVVLDVIYSRGAPAMARPVLDAAGEGRGVVFSEGLGTFSGSKGSDRNIRSFPFLEPRVRPYGLINIEADHDGIFRRYRFLHGGGGATPDPSLALAAYLELRGVRWPEDVTHLAPGKVQWEELSGDGTEIVPRIFHDSPEDSRFLDFRSGWSSRGPAAFRHLTLSELHELHLESRAGAPDTASGLGGDSGARPLAGLSQSRRLPGGTAKPPVSGLPSSPSARALGPLAGKILFVSYVASGVSDFGATPFGSHEPLVHLHSTALNGLLQNSFHVRLPRRVDALSAALVLLMGCGAAWIRTKRALLAFWLLGAGGIATAGFGFIVWSSWVVPSMWMLVVWTISFVGEISRRHTCELIERLKLRTVMGYYFSPRVLKKVLANPGSMEPQKVELTVLLTDLRNFTALSERLDTRGIFALCNQVFEIETREVMAEDGSLEHFLGDQFLSYWGAPDPEPDGANRALRASFSLMKAIRALRETLPPEVKELFGYGLALHSGVAMIGNRGSAQRLDYGVLGDLINSAARVEALTKTYGVPFLITRDTYDKLSDPPLSRVIDCVLPVGKSTPLELLEIQHPLTSDQFSRLAERYTEGFRHYQRGAFTAARSVFETVARDFNDRPSRVLAERCGAWEANPPADWAGIYRFTAK